MVTKLIKQISDSTEQQTPATQENFREDHVGDAQLTEEKYLTSVVGLFLGADLRAF